MRVLMAAIIHMLLGWASLIMIAAIIAYMIITGQSINDLPQGTLGALLTSFIVLAVVNESELEE
jgi:hypothetical protein